MRPRNPHYADVVRRIQAGEAYRDISAALEITRSTVAGIARSAGLADPDRRRREAPDKTRAAYLRGMVAMGLHPDEVPAYAAVRNQGFTRAEAVEIIIGSRRKVVAA